MPAFIEEVGAAGSAPGCRCCLSNYPAIPEGSHHRYLIYLISPEWASRSAVRRRSLLGVFQCAPARWFGLIRSRAHADH